MKIVPALALVSLMALGGALIFTNPSEKKYAEYLSQTLTVETQVELCQPEGFSEWLGKVGAALSAACQELIAGGKELSNEEIQSMILENTEYQNRVVFSTYITETPFGNYRTIGALGRFFTNETEGNAEG
ncbi:MAG: DUF4359 domain-containing protein [Cyanobacteria bacterium P01_F01_bin.53]